MYSHLLNGHLKVSPVFWVILITGALLGAACSAAPTLTQDAEGADAPGSVENTAGRVLTIGEISDEPVKKIERFKPLADYLATGMSDLGFTQGRVVVARDVEEMARFIEEGRVDIYMDSAFPVLDVQRLAETNFILRRWKGGDSSYYSIFVTVDAEAGTALESLSGAVVAGEDEYSTSGYALPASHLIANGLDVRIVPGSETTVPDGSVGVWFTRDEENTFDALANGFARFAMLSNQDLDKAPEDLLPRLVEIGRTGSVPRQIVSVSPRLDETERAEISRLLIGLEASEGGVELLEQVKTAKFDLIPAEDLATLSEFAELLPIIP